MFHIINRGKEYNNLTFSCRTFNYTRTSSWHLQMKCQVELASLKLWNKHYDNHPYIWINRIADSHSISTCHTQLSSRIYLLSKHQFLCYEQYQCSPTFIKPHKSLYLLKPLGNESVCDVSTQIQSPHYSWAGMLKVECQAFLLRLSISKVYI